MQNLQGNALATQDGFSSRHILEAAFRHRRLWLLIATGVFLMSVAYTALRPRQYRSEMDILVQNTRADDQITPSRVNGTVEVNGVTEEQINSEIQLLESRGLAASVVDPAVNSQRVEGMSESQQKARDKAINRFEKNLSVDLVRKSNVIHATYIASSPQKANEALNGLLTAFLAKHREIAQPPGTTQFFANEAARYKNELDKAEQELAAFQQQNQIVTLPDTEQRVDHEISDAETDLRSTEAQIGELTQRIASGTSQLHSISPRQATQQRTIPNDYSVERLNTMLAELQNQRTSLLTKFTPQDRLVQEIDRKIADTRAALKNAQHMTSNERSTDVNPVWQAVTGSIVQAQTDRQALRAKRAALLKQIDELRGGLTKAEGSTVAYTTLRQKVTDLQNSYQLYAQKRDEARMADAMNEDRLLNVIVQQSPTYSAIPYRPRPVVDIALGGFTAVFLASFMVFFAEMGRDTIANAGELERYARFPVLATVPLDSLRAEESAGRLPELGPVLIGFAPGREPEDVRKGSPSLVRYHAERRSL